MKGKTFARGCEQPLRAVRRRKDGKGAERERRPACCQVRRRLRSRKLDCSTRYQSDSSSVSTIWSALYYKRRLIFRRASHSATALRAVAR